MKIKGRQIILSLFLGLFMNMALLGAVSASTVNVNSSMSNSQIQSVLDNAKSGDTINFLGRFYEDVQLTINKTLHLVSSVGTVLSGTNSPGSIVLLITGFNASGTTISGFNITNSRAGVVINSTNWTALSNNRIKSINGSAVTVNGSSNTNLVNNNISNSGTGITVQRSKNTKISSTQVAGSSKNGISVNNSENTALNHDTVTDNNKHGVVVYNSKGTVINGTSVKNSKSNAIGIYNSSKTVINSSKMTGNGKSLDSGYVDPDTGSSREENGNGVYAEKSDKIKVLNCNISENFRGISAKSVSNLTVGNNLLIDNNFEGILLSGNIKTGLIKSNLVQANNNGIKVNAYSLNLTIVGNIMTYNERNFNGCSNGYGLIFGSNFQDNGTTVNHNIITLNTYPYGDGYYGKIFPGLGSNFYGDFDYNIFLNGTGSTNMKLVVIRTGQNKYSAYFADGATGEMVTELPPLWLKITTSDGKSSWVQMNGPITDITTAAGSGDITVAPDTSMTLPYYFNPTLIYGSFAVDSTTTPLDSPITSAPTEIQSYYSDWDDSDILNWIKEEPPTTGGSDPGNNPGSGPDNPGDNPNNNSQTTGGTGSGDNSTVAGPNLSIGLTAVAQALMSAASPAGDEGSNGDGASNTKTAQELFMDNTAKNPQFWGIIGILVLFFIIFGAYYRNDLMNMIQKAKK